MATHMMPVAVFSLIWQTEDRAAASSGIVTK
jgi:hypothetical protein